LVLPLSESFAKSVSTSFGLKAWASTYDFSFASNPSTVLTSDSGNSFGPTFNIRIKKFFGGLNYYRGKFSFKNQNIELFDVTRTDVELYFGYDFVRNFSVIFGLKSINSDYAFSNTNGPDDVISFDYLGNFIAMNAHSNVMGPSFVFFFTHTYTYLDYIEDENVTVDLAQLDLSGQSFEAGVALLAAKNHLIFTLGYKSQSYESDDGLVDEIHGLSGSFNVRF